MTHPSTGTLESFSCHTSGMRCWQDHQSYISNNANNSWHGGNPKPTNNLHMVVTLNPPTSYIMPITSGKVVTLNPPTVTGS